MSSLSPTKDQKVIKSTLENIQKEVINGKILAYSTCKKESRTLGIGNARLLVLNEAAKTIGYANDVPKQIPIADPTKVSLKHTANLMATEARIFMDNKTQLNINAELIQKDGKPKKDKWILTFNKAEQAKDWQTLIRTTKQKIKDQDIRAEKPPQPVNPMTRTEPPVMPPSNLSTIPRPQEPPVPPPSNTNINSSIKPMDPVGSQLPKQQLPVDSYIRTIYQDANSQPKQPNEQPANNMGGSRVDLFKSGPSPNQQPRMINSQIYPPSEIKPKPIEEPTILDDPKPPSQYKPPESNINGQASSHGLPFNSTNQPGNQSYLAPNSTTSYRKPENPPTNNSYVQPPPSNNSYVAPPANNSYAQPPQNSTATPKNPANMGGSFGRIPPPPPQNSNNANDWNSKFTASQDTSILQQFERKAQQLVVSLVNDLSNDRNQQKYQPISSSAQQLVYDIQDLIITLPLINQHSNSLKIVKNEFRNYNYILSIFKNKGTIRVPITCLIEYKGFTGFVKAKVISPSDVDPSEVDAELSELERLSKISKDVFYQQNVLKRSNNNGSVVYVDNLNHYIPIDIYSQKQPSQIRTETIETMGYPVSSGPNGQQNSRNKQSMLGLKEAAEAMRSYSQQVLGLLESFEIVILNTKELSTNMHLNGANLRCLGSMYKSCKNSLIKKYLLSEMVSRVCRSILRQKLQQAILNSSVSDRGRNSSQQIDSLLQDMAFDFVNNVVSKNPESQRIWKNIASEAKNKYQISFSKDDLSVGYLLSSLFEKCNLNYNYELLLEEKEYLKVSNCLKRDFVKGFNVQPRSYNIAYLPMIQRLEEILNEKPSNQGCDQIIQLLDLQQKSIPSILDRYGYDMRIRMYLSHFVNYDGERVGDRGQANKQNLRHLDLYGPITTEPATCRSIRLTFMAIKWRLNPSDMNDALKLYEIAQSSILFWGGQCHPLLSDLYDLFTAHNSSLGKYPEAIDFAKSSIENAVKTGGKNSAIAAEKYYNYGNLCYKAGKKEEALSYFSKTRQINQLNQNADGREQATLCMKMALLNLNLNQNSQCLSKALESLKIVQKLEDNDTELVNLYELLARTYEVGGQKSDLINIANTCSKKLGDCSDPSVIPRMLKIVVQPHLRALNNTQKAGLIQIIEELKKKRISRANEWKDQALSAYDENNVHSNFSQNFINKLDKADRTIHQINEKKLAQSYTGPQSRTSTDSENFLRDLDIVSSIVGDSFVLGTLREDS